MKRAFGELPGEHTSAAYMFRLTFTDSIVRGGGCLFDWRMVTSCESDIDGDDLLLRTTVIFVSQKVLSRQPFVVWSFSNLPMNLGRNLSLTPISPLQLVNEYLLSCIRISIRCVEVHTSLAL